MDFDDLDEEAEARLDAGEAVEGYIKVNGQPPRGTVLPFITRTRRLPKDSMLPEQSQKLIPTTSVFKNLKPRLRLICFYGAGDNVGSGWAALAHEVESDEIEVVTYEWPGHGIREREPLRKTLDDLRDDAYEAVKEVMDSGSFAVLGHSIGCLIATAVCQRARKELNVDPLYSIMLERGSPEHPVLSPAGQDMLRNNIDEFLKYYGVAFVASIGGDHGKAMWQNDMELENDTRPVGFFKYDCPILSVCALRNYGMEMGNLDEKSAAFKKMRETIQYHGNSYNFSGEQYQTWSGWTSHEDGAAVLTVDADHYGVKTHKDVRKAMWKVLKDVVKGFGAARIAGGGAADGEGSADEGG